MDDTAGAFAPQPFPMAAAAAAELAPLTAPASNAPGYVLLTTDIEGVGRTGRVVCARGARTAPWIAANDARLATAAEVDLAQPFHIVIED